VEVTKRWKVPQGKKLEVDKAKLYMDIGYNFIELNCDCTVRAKKVNF